LARTCGSCSFPTQNHDPVCDNCGTELLKGEEAEGARKRWEGLSESIRREFQTEHDRRVQEWREAHRFYERKAPIKHMLAGAAVFGVVGVFSGPLAVAYALSGLVAGLMISRRKGGLFTGTMAGVAVFALVVGVRTVVSLLLPIATLTLLLNAAATHYADRIIGILCPAAGGLLGYLIEQEYEEKG